MKNALTGILVTKAMESIGTAVKEIEAVGENRKVDQKDDIKHLLDYFNNLC